jgi:tRNA (mo5U34)-methyltransferase
MPAFNRRISLNLRRNLRLSLDVEGEFPNPRGIADRLLGRKRPQTARTEEPAPVGPMPVPKAGLPPEEVRARISSVENWYHQIEVAPGVVTPGINPSANQLAAMEVPDDLSGKRVLDVGARDGYFSFVAEARGAEVLAIDSVAPNLTGFDTAAGLLGSPVEYRTMNVYDVVPEAVGSFDAIFFLGVLYHLRDPMLALDRLWSVARPEARIWVESHTIDRGFVDPETKQKKRLSELAPKLAGVPMAQFYPGDQLGGSVANWWGPNLAGLEAMVRSAGFEVERSRLVGGRGLVVGRRVDDPETLYFRDYDRGTVTS